MKKYILVLTLCVALEILMLMCYNQNNNIKQLNSLLDNETNIIRIEAPEVNPKIEYEFYETYIPYEVYMESLSTHTNEKKVITVTSFYATEPLNEKEYNIQETSNANTIAYTIPVEVGCNLEYTELQQYIYYDIDLSDDLQEYTQEVCKEYGINYELVLAIMACESQYDTLAISKTNDYGIMQINECNFEHLQNTFGNNIDFMNAKDNIVAGVYMLSLVKDYASNDSELLMCYNLGVNGAKKKWNAGIYSTPYTEKVINQKESLRIK